MSVVPGLLGALIVLGLLWIAARKAFQAGGAATDNPYAGCASIFAGPFLVAAAWPRLGWWSLAVLGVPWLLLRGAMVVAGALGRGRAASLRHARSSDEDLRLLGVEKLIRHHDPTRKREVRLVLEEALGSPDDLVFETAALELIRLGQGALVRAAVLRGLQAGKAPSTVGGVIEALGPDALRPLAELLATSPVESRLRIVEAIDRFEGAGPALLAAARDASPWVRSAAVERLGRRRSKDALIEALKDVEEAVRAAAARAMAPLADAAFAEPLLAAARDASLGARREIFLALAKLREPRLAGPALASLERGELKAEAAFALGEARAVEAVDALLALLDAPEIEAREAAALALGAIGERRASEGLAKALGSSPDHRARAAAARALRRLGWTPGTPEERAAFAVAGSDDAPLEADEATLAALDVALREPEAAALALKRLERLLTEKAAAFGAERLRRLSELQAVAGPPRGQSYDPTALDASRVRELARKAISPPR